MPVHLTAYLKQVSAEVLTPAVTINDVIITDGYASDMLSDVMGNAKAGQIWITIMKHMNSVAVASMTGIPCILFAKNTRPDVSVIEKAAQEGICLALSDKPAFELAGILYTLLNEQPKPVA